MTEGVRGAYSVFTLWGNDVHSLGNYAFAIGLFALGTGVWDIPLAFVLGSVLLFVLLCLSGYMGHRTGVPFPVMSRISFGIVMADYWLIRKTKVNVAAFSWFFGAGLAGLLYLAFKGRPRPYEDVDGEAIAVPSA